MIIHQKKRISDIWQMTKDKRRLLGLKQIIKKISMLTHTYIQSNAFFFLFAIYKKPTNISQRKLF